MRLLTLEELALQPVPAPHDAAPPRSHLVWRGERLAQQVDGIVCEAACAGEGFTLLFTTDDVPFEERLSITLFDPAWRVLDRAALGRMYCTGSFVLLAVEAPRTVRFRFFGDAEWSLGVLAQPQARLPFLGDPAGVSRPPGLSRRFVLHAAPRG